MPLKAGTLAAVGLTSLVAGVGLIWVSKEGPEIVVMASPDLREPSMAG
ncbi:MAG: hypothetical protein IH818_11550 [Acidobacteria bacterium]|nr:hypothetical protein [Acidobacteriota bacterium]